MSHGKKERKAKTFAFSIALRKPNIRVVICSFLFHSKFDARTNYDNVILTMLMRATEGMNLCD